MSNRGRPPDKQERSLWDRFVDGINPMHKRDEAAPPPSQTKTAGTRKPSRQQPPAYKTANPQSAQKGDNMLDGKTLSRLKKGKMPVEGTIDLHNKTQDQAYGALKRFIVSAVKSEKRCVLVITGKGVNTRADEFFTSTRDGIGILKSRLPEWIAAPPLSDLVLRAQPAHRTHGGDGAYYLYLKNPRKL